jgi:hypothetical protein
MVDLDPKFSKPRRHGCVRRKKQPCKPGCCAVVSRRVYVCNHAGGAVNTRYSLAPLLDNLLMMVLIATNHLANVADKFSGVRRVGRQLHC